MMEMVDVALTTSFNTKITKGYSSLTTNTKDVKKLSGDEKTRLVCLVKRRLCL